MNEKAKNIAINMLSIIPDKLYLSVMFRIKMGSWIDWKHPETFNEKLQWLKVNDRNPLYSTLVDKYLVKDYVKEHLGQEYIIPTLGCWERFDDIDFDVLPDQFVLKCTHDSGGLVICHDKAKLNKGEARRKIEASLKNNFYFSQREWPYKTVKPRIIAEEFLSNLNGEAAVEYKVFCFQGQARMVLVCKGTAHGSGRTNDYCDVNLNRFPFISLNPNSTGEMEKHEQYSKIIEIAERLSQGIPQVRVDTYLVNGKIYFGEMTFFHNAGFAKFEPEEWDQKLGDWIQLPM